MNYLLAQFFLAARNRDDDGGWMQMLVFVVLAVVYAIGSIVKAKANKLEERDKEQLDRKPARRPALKPPERPGDLRKQSLQQLRRPSGPAPRREHRPEVQPPLRKVMRPQPAIQKFAAEAERNVRLRPLEPLEVSKLPLPAPSIELEELPEFTAKTVKKLKDKYAAIPAETYRIEGGIESLLDYDDPEQLKRAILHYEILGKPLSLREPLEF